MREPPPGLNLTTALSRAMPSPPEPYSTAAPLGSELYRKGCSLGGTPATPVGSPRNNISTFGQQIGKSAARLAVEVSPGDAVAMSTKSRERSMAHPSAHQHSGLHKCAKLNSEPWHRWRSTYSCPGFCSFLSGLKAAPSSDPFQRSAALRCPG
jgi:hypothetical protein